MPGIAATFLHPPAQDVTFGLGQLFFRVPGWHGVLPIMKAHEHLAFTRVLGINGPVAAAIRSSCLEGIEAELVLFPGVGSVTDKALVGQDWKNLPGEVDFLCRDSEGTVEQEGAGKESGAAREQVQKCHGVSGVPREWC